MRPEKVQEIAKMVERLREAATDWPDTSVSKGALFDEAATLLESLGERVPPSGLTESPAQAAEQHLVETPALPGAGPAAGDPSSESAAAKELRVLNSVHSFGPTTRAAIERIATLLESRQEDAARWVIEAPFIPDGSNIHFGEPRYWDGRGPDTFSFDHLEAVRFVRKEDAERVLYWMIAKNRQAECRATEHIWMDAARKEQS
jgi:hypothetical protein